MSTSFLFILEKNLSSIQKEQIGKFNEESFGDVSLEEKEENFIAKPFARLIAYLDGIPVGTLQLFKRENRFASKSFMLGGIGGVCVTEKHRKKGIGKELIQKALEILRNEHCDVACLNVDSKKLAFKLYEKVGFVLMDRDASFENSKGEIIYEPGTMFAPVLSQSIFALIMQSSETFHYGVGYW